ncbi:glycosyltransferase family 2 protein [Pedobacter fastidiosus]|uniref:Glycosyltransferase n=1 Tax=Pedobacter fastidiosus TaxID=2765361 RepID=A0ABR7KVW4_9SPHI|nr:glycosyltransferase family 2 protein [Pedobacter fastidiosus]MBC6112180.1 glycosyltransferase [Pedobacter fastidiosus]
MHNSISYFIPAYNCENTIEESIDSIMVGNFESGDELVIVNDCSTDLTSEVLLRAKEKYPEILIINHYRNKGGSSARNTAIENSNNDLLFCLDSDNVLEPNSICSLKNYLIDNNADAASFQHQHYFSETTLDIQYTWTLPKGETPLSDFLNGSNTPAQHGNYLFTKKSWCKVNGYSEGVGALDTWTFGLKQAIMNSKFIVLEHTHYFHRLQNTSYYINDAHKKMWTVSLKIMFALLPYFDRIDEKFVSYMFKNKYNWFYNLHKRPIILVDTVSKLRYYDIVQDKLYLSVYPRQSMYRRMINKILRLIKFE